MCRDGIKTEEYLEIKPYWISRLCTKHVGAIGGDFMDKHKVIAYFFKNFDEVHSANGYGKKAPLLKWDHLGISIGTGKEEWGAEPNKEYFVLKIGEIIK